MSDMSRTIFISHASVDAALATRIADALEAQGAAAWIAPRDIPAGADYADSIIEGLERSDSLLVVVTAASLASRHVRAEVARAVDQGLTIYPVRVAGAALSGGLSFFLELSQWLDLADADAPVEPVAAAVLSPRATPAASGAASPNASAAGRANAGRRAAFAAIALGCAALAAGGYWMSRSAPASIVVEDVAATPVAAPGVFAALAAPLGQNHGLLSSGRLTNLLDVPVWDGRADLRAMRDKAAGLKSDARVEFERADAIADLPQEPDGLTPELLGAAGLPTDLADTYEGRTLFLRSYLRSEARTARAVAETMDSFADDLLAVAECELLFELRVANTGGSVGRIYADATVRLTTGETIAAKTGGVVKFESYGGAVPTRGGGEGASAERDIPLAPDERATIWLVGDGVITGEACLTPVVEAVELRTNAS